MVQVYKMKLVSIAGYCLNFNFNIICRLPQFHATINISLCNAFCVTVSVTQQSY